MALGLLLTSGSRQAALFAGFFWIALVWPATLLAYRIAGRRAGHASVAVALLLFACQVLLPPPRLHISPLILERRFEHAGQAVRHTLSLPLKSSAWGALWASPSTRAYLYIMLVTDAGVTDPGLRVHLGEEHLGDLGPEARLPENEGWHRLPVSGRQLETHTPLVVTITPDPARLPSLPSVGIVGGYSFRPTFGQHASVFFDGQQWLSDARTLFPAYVPSRREPVRFYVELRIVDSESGKLRAIYY